MHLEPDTRSKLYDGIVCFILIILMLVVANLLISPARYFGTVGLLVYAVILLAIAIYCLEQAMNPELMEITRIRFGIFGGLLAWVMTTAASQIGYPVINQENGILQWMLVGLVVYRLWKPVLPQGVRFWLAVLLLNWLAQIIFYGEVYMTRYVPMIAQLYQGLGYVAVVAALGLLYWVLAVSKTRIQRCWGAVGLMFFAVLAFNFFLGGPV